MKIVIVVKIMKLAIYPLDSILLIFGGTAPPVGESKELPTYAIRYLTINERMHNYVVFMELLFAHSIWIHLLLSNTHLNGVGNGMFKRINIGTYLSSKSTCKVSLI